MLVYYNYKMLCCQNVSKVSNMYPKLLGYFIGQRGDMSGLLPTTTIYRLISLITSELQCEKKTVADRLHF